MTLVAWSNKPQEKSLASYIATERAVRKTVARISRTTEINPSVRISRVIGSISVMTAYPRSRIRLPWRSARARNAGGTTVVVPGSSTNAGPSNVASGGSFTRS